MILRKYEHFSNLIIALGCPCLVLYYPHHKWTRIWLLRALESALPVEMFPTTTKRSKRWQVTFERISYRRVCSFKKQQVPGAPTQCHQRNQCEVNSEGLSKHVISSEFRRHSWIPHKWVLCPNDARKPKPRLASATNLSFRFGTGSGDRIGRGSATVSLLIPLAGGSALCLTNNGWTHLPRHPTHDDII
jgi:hypothetical protein